MRRFVWEIVTEVVFHDQLEKCPFASIGSGAVPARMVTVKVPDKDCVRPEAEKSTYILCRQWSAREEVHVDKERCCANAEEALCLEVHRGMGNSEAERVEL